MKRRPKEARRGGHARRSCKAATMTAVFQAGVCKICQICMRKGTLNTARKPRTHPDTRRHTPIANTVRTVTQSYCAHRCPPQLYRRDPALANAVMGSVRSVVGDKADALVGLHPTGQQHPPLPFLSPLTPPGRRGFEQGRLARDRRARAWAPARWGAHTGPSGAMHTRD